MKWASIFLLWSRNVRAKQHRRSGLLLACCFLLGAWTKGELVEMETPPERELRLIREQESQKLEDFFKTHSRVDFQKKLEIFLRLQEIYSESSHFFFTLEGRLFEKKNRALPVQKIDRSFSRSFLQRAVTLAEKWISQSSPPFPQGFDAVFYSLGFQSYELEALGTSQKAFEKLIQFFPKSSWKGMAHRFLGEILEKENHYVEAEKEYGLAISFASTWKEKRRLLRKQAWSVFRQNQAERALGLLQKIFETIETEAVNEKQEWLQDWIQISVETKLEPEVLGAFLLKQLEEKKEWPFLEKWIFAYERTLKHQETEKALNFLFQKFPNSELVWRLKVHQAEKQEPHWEQVWSVLEGLVWKNFRIDLKNNAGALQDSLDRALSLGHRLATAQHQQKKWIFAEKAYEWQLALLNHTGVETQRKKIIPLQLALIEVKRELKKDEEVNHLFKIILASKDVGLFSLEKIVLAWLAALEEQLVRTEDKKKRQQAEHLFETSTENLRKINPVHPELVEMDLRLAQWKVTDPLQKSQAFVILKRLLTQWSRSEQAWLAAQLWIQSVEPASHPELVSFLKTLSGLLSWDQQKHQGQLMRWLEQKNLEFQTQVITAQEQKKDWKGALLGYERFAMEAKSLPQKKTALEKALQIAADQGLEEDFLRLFPLWKKMPVSPSSIQTKEAWSRLWLFRALFVEDAKAISRWTSFFFSELPSSSFWEEGALWEEVQGHWETVIAYWNRLPASPEKDLHLGRAYAESGKKELALQHYEACLTLADCWIERIDRLTQWGYLAQAEQVWKALAEAQELSSLLVSYARYRIFSQELKSATFQPLKLPQKTLQHGLAERFLFQKKMNTRLEWVLKAHGPWFIDGVRDLMTWIEKYAREVEATAPLPEFDEQAVQHFRKSLEPVTQLLRQQGQALRKEQVKETNNNHWLSGERARSSEKEEGVLASWPTVSDSPYSSVSWAVKAQQYWKKNKKKEALWASRLALKIDPQDIRLWNDQAVFRLGKKWPACLPERLKDQEALEVFLRILNKHPYFEPAVQNRAQLLRRDPG